MGAEAWLQTIYLFGGRSLLFFRLMESIRWAHFLCQFLSKVIGFVCTEITVRQSTRRQLRNSCPKLSPWVN